MGGLRPWISGKLGFLPLLLIGFLTGCRAGPPLESGHFREPDLVEIVRLDPGIRLNIRYAGPNNFTGRPLYPEARAFLQRPAALALVRVHRVLKDEGYGILVYDAYRPWSVTRALWEVASESERKQGFVADPAQGSRHNRGCAVDVGLYELASGSVVPMPSGYDEFSPRAHSGYSGGPAEPRRHRDILRRAMAAEGFTVLANEWWHFDYRDWRRYRLLDMPFEDIRH